MQHSNSTVVVLIDLSAVGHGGVPLIELIYRETTHKAIFSICGGDVRKVGQALEAAVLVEGNN